ncbi:MAG: hypothetical protein ACPK85_04075 [Methanosarcina sp.]
MTLGESELDEVRAIEEAFKKAYDEDSEGTAKAVGKIRDFAINLIRFKPTLENELDAKALMISIGDIARVAAERKIEEACTASCNALKDIAIEAARQQREALAVKGSSIIGNLALEFTTGRLHKTAEIAAGAIGNCGKAFSNLNLETLASLCEIYLMRVTYKAMEKNLPGVGLLSITLLGQIGAASAGKIMEISTLEAAVILEDLGNAAAREENDAYVKATVRALENIGEAVSQYGLKSVLVQVAWALETLRLLAKEQGLQTAEQEAKAAVEALNTAGILDEEQNLEKIQEIKKFHDLVLRKE